MWLVAGNELGPEGAKALVEVLGRLTQLGNLNLACTLCVVVAFVVCVRVELSVAALTRWGVVVRRQ